MSDIDDGLKDLSWYRVAENATQLRKTLEATLRELDRVNAELIRVRRELTELTDLSRSK